MSIGKLGARSAIARHNSGKTEEVHNLLQNLSKRSVEWIQLWMILSSNACTLHCSVHLNYRMIVIFIYTSVWTTKCWGAILQEYVEL